VKYIQSIAILLLLPLLLPSHSTQPWQCINQ